MSLVFRISSSVLQTFVLWAIRQRNVWLWFSYTGWISRRILRYADSVAFSSVCNHMCWWTSRTHIERNNSLEAGPHVIYRFIYDLSRPCRRVGLIMHAVHASYGIRHAGTLRFVWHLRRDLTLCIFCLYYRYVNTLFWFPHLKTWFHSCINTQIYSLTTLHCLRAKIKRDIWNYAKFNK